MIFSESELQGRLLDASIDLTTSEVVLSDEKLYFEAMKQFEAVITCDRTKLNLPSDMEHDQVEDLLLGRVVVNMLDSSRYYGRLLEGISVEGQHA